MVFQLQGVHPGVFLSPKTFTGIFLNIAATKMPGTHRKLQAAPFILFFFFLMYNLSIPWSCASFPTLLTIVSFFSPLYGV